VKRDVIDALLRMVPVGAVARVWEGLEVPDLMGNEAEAVARAVPERRAEFARGRACARLALAALGGPAVAIPVGEGRAPEWPEGFVGSITHTSGLVAAVVAPAALVPGVGVDAEVYRPLPHEVRHMVLTPAERDDVGTELETVVFSAKESIYKALYPRRRRWLDFQDVEVRLDSSVGRFVAVAVREEDRATLAALQGSYAVVGGYALTCCALAVPKID
jgi:4'-phosphopantetheinyl transferase EntD